MAKASSIARDADDPPPTPPGAGTDTTDGVGVVEGLTGDCGAELQPAATDPGDDSG
jgi:hypothetical protein